MNSITQNNDKFLTITANGKNEIELDLSKLTKSGKEGFIIVPGDSPLHDINIKVINGEADGKLSMTRGKATLDFELTQPNANIHLNKDFGFNSASSSGIKLLFPNFQDMRKQKNNKKKKTSSVSGPESFEKAHQRRTSSTSSTQTTAADRKDEAKKEAADLDNATKKILPPKLDGDDNSSTIEEITPSTDKKKGIDDTNSIDTNSVASSSLSTHGSVSEEEETILQADTINTSTIDTKGTGIQEKKSHSSRNNSQATNRKSTEQLSNPNNHRELFFRVVGAINQRKKQPLVELKESLNAEHQKELTDTKKAKPGDELFLKEVDKKYNITIKYLDNELSKYKN